IAEPLGGQPPEAARDAGDEELLPGLGAPAHAKHLGARRGREVEELFWAFARNARHEGLDNRPHPDGAATRRWTMMVLVALALALAAPAAALDLDAARLLDLTHPFDAPPIYWPTAKPFTLEP